VKQKNNNKNNAENHCGKNSLENEPKIDKQKTCVKIMMIRKKIKKRSEKGKRPENEIKKRNQVRVGFVGVSIFLPLVP
jgi:hypothetical protein